MLIIRFNVMRREVYLQEILEFHLRLFVWFHHHHLDVSPLWIMNIKTNAQFLRKTRKPETRANQLLDSECFRNCFLVHNNVFLTFLYIRALGIKQKYSKAPLNIILCMNGWVYLSIPTEKQGIRMVNLTLPKLLVIIDPNRWHFLYA